MNSVLEHEVNEVRRRLDELVQLLQVLQLSTLLLVENIEIILGGVKLHVLDLGGQVGLLLGDLLVALLKFLFLVLERADFFVNLLLHHLVQVLLLDL